jgi:hypothetical protein
MVQRLLSAFFFFLVDLIIFILFVDWIVDPTRDSKEYLIFRRGFGSTFLAIQVDDRRSSIRTVVGSAC